MKNLNIFFIGIACAVLMACKSNTVYQTAGFHGDVRHSGFYETRGMDTLRGVAWSFKTGGRVFSSSVISGDELFIGSDYGHVYALNAMSGKLIWKFRTGGRVSSSPAYANNTVYFGSWDSYLYALNSENGSLKWKFKAGIDTVYYNQVGFQSSPVVYQGMVYSGCRDAHVYAIEAETGDLKWKYFNDFSWVIATPAIHNDTLYFETSDSHKLIALNAVNGKHLYTSDCKTYGFSSPALADGKIYLGNQGGSLMAFETATGKTLWEFQTPAAKANRDSIIAPNGEFNNAKIFTENSYDANLKAVDLIYTLGSVLSSPAVWNGMVFFGSTDSCVYALH